MAKDDEKQFEEFLEGVRFDDEPNAAHCDRLEQKLLAARQKQLAGSGLGLGDLFKSSFIKFAAAAVIIVVVLVAVLVVITITSQRDQELPIAGREDKPPTIVPKQEPKKEEIVAVEKPDITEQDPDAEDEKLFAGFMKIMEMRQSSDIDGLIAALSDETEIVRIMAANFLADIGDEDSLVVLERLIADENLTSPENPIVQAVQKLRNRLSAVTDQTEKPTGEKIVKPTPQQMITYSGVVKNEAGVPIEGVSVWSHTLGPGDYRFDIPSKAFELESMTQTDGKGLFTLGPLTKVKEGELYRMVIFDHPDHSIGWFFPSWEKNWGFDAGGLQITLYEPAVIAGIVIDSQGKPVKDAVVQAKLTMQTPKHFQYISLCRSNDMAVLTNEEGEFIFENIPYNTRAEVEVQHAEYATYNTGGEVVRTGEDNLNVVLEPGGVIKGTLVTGGNLYKKEGLKIIVKGQEDEHWEWSLGWSDENGRFEMTGFKAGTYSVIVDTEFLEKEKMACKGVENVEVAPGEAGPQIQLELEMGLSVTVMVYDEDSDEPIKEKYVSISLLGNDKMDVARGKTDEEGKYSTRLIEGEYTLIVNGWEDGELNKFTKDISVSAGIAPLEVEIAIAARSMIYGRLVDTDGQPVKGVMSVSSSEKVETDEQGGFVISQPYTYKYEGHTYSWAFDADKVLGKAFLWRPQDYVVKSPKQVDPFAYPPPIEQDNELRIILEPLASIGGRIIDPNGRAVLDTNVEVSIQISDDTGIGFSGVQWWCEIQKQPDGFFEIDSIPVGLPMELSWKKRGYYDSKIDLSELQAGQHQDFGQIILEPLEGFKEGQIWEGFITGMVLDENGEPLVEARVSAVYGDEKFRDTTDIHGLYELIGLPQGKEISITAFSEGYYAKKLRAICDANDFNIQIFPYGYVWDDEDPAIGMHVDEWLQYEPAILEAVQGKVALLNLHQIADEETQKLMYGIVAKKYEEYRDRGELTIAGFYSVFELEHRPGLYLIDKTGIVRATPSVENLDEWIEELLAEGP